MSIRTSVRMRCNFTPVIVQCAEDLLVTSSTYAGSGQHHQIAVTKHCLVLAKALSYQALYTVSLYRVARRLDRYRCSKTRMIQTVGNSHYRHETIAGFDFTLPKHPLVVFCCQQAKLARIARCRSSQGDGVRLTGVRALSPGEPL